MASLKERIAAERAKQKRIAEVKANPVVHGDSGTSGRLQKFGEGVAHSALSTAYGIKDLFTDLTDEEKENLKGLSESAGESGWGTFGKVVGEIAQIAVPAGGVGAGAKALTKVPALSRAAGAVARSPIARDMAAAAAVGAAKSPTDDMSRLRRAGTEAAVAGIGGKALQAGGKLLKRATKGIKRTPEADFLLGEGVPLTPGQAAPKGSLVDVVETTTQKSAPFRTSKLTEMKEEAGDVWRKNVFQKALPATSKKRVTGDGFNAYSQVNKEFNKLYDEAWEGSAGLTSDLGENLSKGLKETAESYNPDDAQILNRIKQAVDKHIVDVKGGKKYYKAASPQQLKRIDEKIGREISKTKNPSLIEDIEGYRWLIRDTLPESSFNKLNIVDRAYPGKLVLQRAVTAANKSGGKFNPTQLSGASRGVGGRQRTAMGAAPFQDYITASGATVGKPVAPTPEGMAGFLMKNLVNLNPLPSTTTRNLLLGQTLPQRGVQAIGRQPLTRALRNVSPSGGAVSAAMFEEGAY